MRIYNMGWSLLILPSLSDCSEAATQHDAGVDVLHGLWFLPTRPFYRMNGNPNSSYQAKAASSSKLGRLLLYIHQTSGYSWLLTNKAVIVDYSQYWGLEGLIHRHSYIIFIYSEVVKWLEPVLYFWIRLTRMFKLCEWPQRHISCTAFYVWILQIGGPNCLNFGQSFQRAVSMETLAFLHFIFFIDWLSNTEVKIEGSKEWVV